MAVAPRETVSAGSLSGSPPVPEHNLREY